MACYRKGGCGPYEMLPCGECPASKPEYLKRYDDPKPEPRKKNCGHPAAEGGSMKGTIISGEEVLKIIASGDLENISKIYKIYNTLGLTQMSEISGISLWTVIKDCHNEDAIFIKIEK